MSYEYANFNRSLTVREGQLGHTDKSVVGIKVRDSNEAEAFVTAEEAPAVALAILEAAGIEYVTTAEASNPTIYISPERFAATSLQEWKRLHDKRAEREAEDAKVVEFHAAIGANLNRIERHHRDLYNAARKFFEEA